MSTKEAGNDDLPTRIKLLKWGTNDTKKGPVKVGDKTLEVLSANQAKAGFDTISMDFDHQTVPGSPTFKGDPCHVAAKGCTLEVVKGEGLYLNVGSYTPKGQEFASNYDDVSAAILLDEETGEVAFVHSAGLCRQGAAEGIRFYSVNPLAAPVVEEEKAATEPAKVVVTLAVNLDKLRQLLQLDAGATEADITAAIDTALSGTKAEPTAEMKTLSARLDLVERENIVGTARAAGKVIPADWLPAADGTGGKPVGELRTLCAALTAGVVPLAAKTPEKIQEDPDAKAKAQIRTLSADEQLICRQLGVKPEKYLALSN